MGQGEGVVWHRPGCHCCSQLRQQSCDMKIGVQRGTGQRGKGPWPGSPEVLALPPRAILPGLLFRECEQETFTLSSKPLRSGSSMWLATERVLVSGLFCVSACLSLRGSRSPSEKLGCNGRNAERKLLTSGIGCLDPWSGGCRVTRVSLHSNHPPSIPRGRTPEADVGVT